MRQAIFAFVGVLFAAGLLLPWGAQAFTVEKNVNSGAPPIEKIVIFDKGQPHDHIILKDATGNTKPGFAADGAIEVKITGNKEIKPMISWTPKGDLKESFDPSQYSYVIIRMALEGDVKRTFPNGKISGSRPDNLWFSAMLYDKAGERSMPASLSAVTDDDRTPDKMVTLKIPTILFTKGAFNDIKNIVAIGFPWPNTHDYNDRQFRLVIERISLAD